MHNKDRDNPKKGLCIKNRECRWQTSHCDTFLAMKKRAFKGVRDGILVLGGLGFAWFR